MKNETSNLRLAGSRPTLCIGKHGLPSSEMGTWHMDNDGIMAAYGVCACNGVVILPRSRDGSGIYRYNQGNAPQE